MDSHLHSISIANQHGNYITQAYMQQNFSSQNPFIAEYKILVTIVYRIAGKFGEFGKSSAIRQTKTIQISSYHW